MSRSNIHFIVGGSRSGKSKIAEDLASLSKTTVHYLATCRTDQLDDEMKDRIQRHKEQRPASWNTLENQFDLPTIAKTVKNQCILIDCLTLWLANEMSGNNIDQILTNLDEGLEAFENNNVNTIIVSNEVGMGIVPIGKETREYRDLVGWANQRVSKRAATVIWTVAGIPVALKKEGKACGLNMEAM